MALLTFLGATQQVTGSCYLIETRDGAKVLLECGMRQGRREDEAQNRAPFAFDPASLDAVVISHAHIDHTGLLPRLVASGYRGPIFATEATCDLMELMLLDAANLQEKDAEWENKWRARLGKAFVEPLYTVADTEQQQVCLHYLLNILQPLPWQQSVLVSLNPVREPNPLKVIQEISYDHPVFDQAAIDAQSPLPAIQGKGGIWYAGAWCGYGFHEDGYQAGMRVAEAIECQHRQAA